MKSFTFVLVALMTAGHLQGVNAQSIYDSLKRKPALVTPTADLDSPDDWVTVKPASDVDAIPTDDPAPTCPAFSGLPSRTSQRPPQYYRTLVFTAPRAHFDWPAIALANDCGMAVAGIFTGSNTDLNPLAGVSSATSNGMEDVFISKFNPDGSFAWAINFGGTATDSVSDIRFDPSGNLYVTGFVKGTVNILGQTVSATANTPTVYILSLNPIGQLRWLKTMNSTGALRPVALSKSVSNNSIILAGIFSGAAQFDRPNGAIYNSRNRYPALPPGSQDIFAAQFSTDGAFQRVITLGGFGTESIGGVDFDSGGNLIITGTYDGEVDFNNDPVGQAVVTPNTSYKNHGFVVKYALTGPNGSYLWKWTPLFPNPSANYVAFQDLAIEGNNLAITGSVIGTGNLGTGGAGLVTAQGSGGDVLLAQIDSSSGNFLSASTFGAVCTVNPSQPSVCGPDAGTHIAIDTLRDRIVTGVFENFAAFMYGANLSQSTTNYTFTIPFADHLRTGQFGEIVYSGSLNGSADMDPTAGTDQRGEANPLLTSFFVTTLAK